MHAVFLHPCVEPRQLNTVILGEQNTVVTVTLNSPVSLHCYAVGWPRPIITWWRGRDILPLSSDVYVQDADYTLLIRSVTLPTLGVYTCQAFNGVGRAASWSVTLQAVGPVYSVRPEYEQYTQYLVLPPKKMTAEKPQYPYRPIRNQTQETYAPVYSSRQPHIPTVAPIGGLTTQDPNVSRFRGEGTNI